MTDTKLPINKQLAFLVLGSIVTGLASGIAPDLTLRLLGYTLGVLILYLLTFVQPWRWFHFYIFLLPPHILLMTVLLVLIGIPAGVVKGISAWKEIILCVLLYSAISKLMKRSTVVITLPDLAVALYILYVGLFAGFAIFQHGGSISLLYSLRDYLLPVCVYWVGRSVAFPEHMAENVFRLLLKVALWVSVLGIIEWFVIPTRWHVLLGVPQYFRDLLGITYPSYLFGLPENYWTSANSGMMRRAVSIYGTSQGFALSYLLLIPVCLYGAVYRSLSHRRLAQIALVLAFVGLSLSFTRFTFAICLILAAIACIKAVGRAKVIIVSLGVGFYSLVLLCLFSNQLRMFLINTLTFQDHSSSMRLMVWGNTIRMVLAHPFGYGLGTVGQTSARFGAMVVSIEGQYSKIAFELGLIGLLLYIGVLASIGVYTFRATRRVHAPYQRGVCWVVTMTILGLVINSMTTEWHNSPSLVYLSFWLAGACVSCGAQAPWSTLSTSSDDDVQQDVAQQERIDGAYHRSRDGEELSQLSTAR